MAAAFLAPIRVSAEPAPAPDAVRSTLRWNNGDTIQGDLIGADETGLTWNSPFFGAPLQPAWSALSRMDRRIPSETAPDPFGVILRDGSYLYGELTALNDAAVTLHGSRHGDVTIKRGEVASIRRLRGKNLLWAGPSGAVGWKLVTDRNTTKKNTPPQPAIEPLIGSAGGALSLPYFNRGASLDLHLPDLVDVEFHLRATTRPDFQLILAGDPKKDNLRLETWDDELVLVAGDQFCLVRKIADGERTLDARLCWNRKDRRCVVFTTDGKQLVEWTPPENKNSEHPGLTLQNKGRSLSLEFLRVRTWDGNPPPAADPKRASIELEDGRMIAGDGLSVRDGTLTIRSSASNEPPATSPLADVDAIYLRAETVPLATPREILSFADGTYLPQEIVAIKDGMATLRTALADTPFTARLDGLCQLRIKVPGTPERPLEELDTLRIEHATLHGNLVCNGSTVPLWLAVGSKEPAPLAASVAGEIKRALPADLKIVPAPALIYTGTGDVLPGVLHAIDRDGAEFDSGIVAVKKLPADDIDAIQFGTVARTKVSGFTDPTWQILKGDEKTVKREGDSLEMEPGTSLGNFYAMQGSEVAFTLASNSYCTVRLRMFCAGVDPKGATNLLFMVSGGTVYSGLENGNNQIMDRQQTATGSGPLSVRLLITDNGVDLYLNGAWAQSCAAPFAGRPGSGLMIEPASMWGNQMRAIKLSQFVATLTPGQMPAPHVNSEARLQALTVPRFLKDDMPRQALVALNGDVLRGEIEGTTKSHLGFRAGLENLNVPLDRVAAAIWLQKPLPAPAIAEKLAPTKLLDQTMTRKLKVQNVSLETVVDFLKRAVPELVIKLPENAAFKGAPRTAKFELGGTTYAKVLDEICSAFDLSYRADADGTINLLVGKPQKIELTQKVYWLETNAVGSGPPVQETLTAKGIAFPAGATVDWKESVRLLSMNNTSANQTRLLALLESDFGGVADTPTHWLQLVNGGRLGLKVDRFDADAVVGQHPIYGACRVALQDVYMIRSSMPAPSAAIKALHDWRLVLAPEPVLPEAGGETSPLLGKAAKLFKVPLLGGGDFDLGNEQGKVVVLDFWATWCGPCIQSMPGVINAVAGFPADQVRLVAMNQSEPEEIVKRFLETRKLKLTVGMDAGAKVGHDYGADAIPLTVIIGRDGKVAWVKTGASPDGETEVATAIKKLLDPQPALEASAK